MPKKKQKTKKRFSGRPIWLTVIIGGVLIFIIGNLIASAITQKRLENNFSKTEKDIDILSGDLAKSIPGLIVKKDNYCHRENFKLSEGPLRCRLGITSQSILSVAEASKIIPLLESKNWQEVHKNPTDKTFSVKDFKNTNTSVICRLLFSNNSNLGEVPRYSFEFYCSELSKRELYPYKHNPSR